MVKRFVGPRSRWSLNKALGYGPLYSFLEFDAWDTVSWFDDFLGTVHTNATTATDAGAYSKKTNDDGDFLILADQTNGVAELRVSDGTGSNQDYSIAYLNNLNFRGDQAAGCAFRIHVDTPGTTCRVELGFTDSEDDAMIIQDGKLDSIGDDASMTAGVLNAAFWAFDTDETSDDWHHAGVKANVETDVVDSGITPAAGTYETLGIQLTGDMAEFFRLDANGKETYRVQTDNAITETTAILPFIAIQAKGAGIDRNLRIDYWASWQRRTTTS